MTNKQLYSLFHPFHMVRLIRIETQINGDFCGHMSTKWISFWVLDLVERWF